MAAHRGTVMAGLVPATHVLNVPQSVAWMERSAIRDGLSRIALRSMRDTSFK
jgi:hypothetical protein